MTSKEIDADAARDPREQILSAVRKGHSVTLDAFKVVVDRAAPVTSKVPAPKLPSAKIPATKLPAVNVPRPDLSGAREFAGQLRDEQRSFNSEFLKTAAGLHPVFGGAADETDTEEIPHGPHGPGSAHPLEDGSAPHERFHIKGNADSGLFHGKDSQHYDRTKAEVWFDSEESARAAGYKHWNHRKR